MLPVHVMFIYIYLAPVVGFFAVTGSNQTAKPTPAFRASSEITSEKSQPTKLINVCFSRFWLHVYLGLSPMPSNSQQQGIIIYL